MKTIFATLLSTFWIAISLAGEKDYKAHDKQFRAAAGVATSLPRPSESNLDDLQRELKSIDNVPRLCIAAVKTLEEQPYRLVVAQQACEGIIAVRLLPSALLRGRDNLRNIIININMYANIGWHTEDMQTHVGLSSAQQRHIVDHESSLALLTPLSITRGSLPSHEDLQKRYAAVLNQCTAGTWKEKSLEGSGAWRLFTEQPTSLNRDGIGLLSALANEILGQEHIKVRALEAYDSTPCILVQSGSVDLARKKLNLKLVEKVYTPAEALLYE